jgi:hypothetical protein
LAWTAPLTYDEAYNWLAYRPLGWPGIVRTYREPNNQVPFTLLHVLVPEAAVARSPWALRSFAVVFGIVLILVIAKLTIRAGTNGIVPVLLVVASPLLVCYLFVARSYGACSLFVIAAVVAATSRPRNPVVLAAAAGLSVATWALPTNVFLVPGWLLVVLAISGWRLATAAALVYSFLCGVMFAPIAGDVLRNAKIDWAGGRWALPNLPNGASYLPAFLLAATTLVAFDGIRRWKRHGAPFDLRNRSPRGRLAAACLVMVLSWFAVLAFGLLVGVRMPFARNAVPVLWLCIVAMITAFPSEVRLRWATTVLLAPAAVVGVFWISDATRNGRWDRISPVVAEATAVSIRDIHTGDADHLSCNVPDGPVCTVSEPMLTRAGITVEIASSRWWPNLPCVRGKHRPDKPYQVIVYRAGQVLGILCN